MNRVQLLDFARRGLKVAGEVATVAVQLRADSGILGIASVAAKIGSTLLEQHETEPFGGWSTVGGLSQLGDFCLTLAKRQGLLTEEPTERKSTRHLAGTIGGVRIGWTQYDRWIDGPYLAPEYSDDDAVAALRVLVWASIGKAVRFVPPVQGAIISSPILLPDGLDETRPSRTAVDLWERQSAFLAAGHRRAVMLIGEPNTGKSNIVRHIATLAGGYTLRIEASELGHLRSLGTLCQFLAPDAVIIDDLDRAPDPGAVIAKLDELLRFTRLVLVTVNRLEQPKGGEPSAIKGLDPAAVRRFDDIRIIDSLDPEVLDALLVGVPEEAAARLRGLPVGYIDQFRKISDVLGPERAIAEIDDIVAKRDLVVRLLAAQTPEPPTLIAKAPT